MLRRLRLVVLVRLIMLRLMVLLFARVERLRLRCIGLAAHLRLLGIAVVIAVVREITARVAARLLLLVIGLSLTQLLLRGGNQAKIMFGMLVVIFGGDRVAGALRVAGELKIFFADMLSRTANLDVGSA